MGSLTATRPDVYPTHVLEGETALCLFAAAFGGEQDAAFLRDAGLKTTCVDHDHRALGAMVLQYPEGWEYVHADVFDYTSVTKRKWDVVSIDCPTGAFARCAMLLERWCALARDAVILGAGPNFALSPPAGWELKDVLRRSSFRGGVFWAVFEREV